MNKKEKIARLVGVLLCEAFAVFTIVMMIVGKKYDKLLLAIVTPFIILIPKTAERIFNCKISLPMYLFGLFYAIGPIIGQCYGLYFTVSWWDKLLHMSGGVIFVFFGAFLFEKYVGKDKRQTLMTAVFALCFSISIAVLWEFYEFGADIFLGTDMQHDRVVTHVSSYLLEENLGVVGSIENIEEVTVNGRPLPVKGYIDIGLIDTMGDMLLESVGALVVAIVYIASKGKCTAFEKKEAAGAENPDKGG